MLADPLSDIMRRAPPPASASQLVGLSREARETVYKSLGLTVGAKLRLENEVRRLDNDVLHQSSGSCSTSPLKEQPEAAEALPIDSANVGKVDPSKMVAALLDRKVGYKLVSSGVLLAALGSKASADGAIVLAVAEGIEPLENLAEVMAEGLEALKFGGGGDGGGGDASSSSSSSSISGSSSSSSGSSCSSGDSSSSTIDSCSSGGGNSSRSIQGTCRKLRRCLKSLNLPPSTSEMRSSEFAVETCLALAESCVEAELWWEALFAAYSAQNANSLRVSAHAGSLERAARLRMARRGQLLLGASAAKLGFLEIAADALRGCVEARKLAAETGAGADAADLGPAVELRALELAAEVEAQLRAARDGGGLEAVIARLSAALGDATALGSDAVVAWELARSHRVIEGLVCNAEGRAQLSRNGLASEEMRLLDVPDTPDAPDAPDSSTLEERELEHARLRSVATSRAFHAHVLYFARNLIAKHMEKRVDAGVAIASSAFESAPATECVVPGAFPLLDARALQTLREQRLVVVDGAIPHEVIRGAADEAAQLHRDGSMTCDATDLCAPNTRRYDLRLHPAGRVALRGSRPNLVACADALRSLAHVLERELQLELRVPQTAMLTAMPPGAAYRPHMDSDGTDSPRILTILLYLRYEPADRGELRILGGVGEDESCTQRQERDIPPLPGRVVVFFAREVRHAVLASAGERFALTQWLWK
jgi:hypothetical protein